MHNASDWRSYLQELPAYAPTAPLDSERVALLVIDMQHCSAGRNSMSGRFLREHYPDIYNSYFNHVDRIIPPIARLIRNFRQTRKHIIYTRVASLLPDGTDFEPQRRFREKEFESEFGERSVLTHYLHPEAQILEELAPSEQDLVLTKVSSGAFNSSAIDQLLRNMGITSLVITGVVTNGCVGATAVDAADRGYRTVLVEDGCAAITPVLHEATLLNFSHIFGRVLKSSEVLNELGTTVEQIRSIASAEPTR